MFESAEIGHKLKKETFEKQLPKLREALLDAQFDLWEQKRFPVVILLHGLESSGRSEMANALNNWFDPRRIDTYAEIEPTDEERERPFMWRFWRALPKKGTISIFLTSWYTPPFNIAFENGGKLGKRIDRTIEQINRFERMLADEGALVLKFWLHMSKPDQKRRIAAMYDDKDTRWRLTERDWHALEHYKRIRRIVGHGIRLTNQAHAPWHIVEATDRQYREMEIGRKIADRMRRRLDARIAAPCAAAPKPAPAIDGKRLLDALDHTQRLGENDYERLLDKYQRKLALLARDKKFARRSYVAVFEGFDAAGKGGAIQRVTNALDARVRKVIRIGAPNEEEAGYPYLWRFWRALPRRGRLTVFDRSWYGRVLVERIEGYCREEDWLRAFSEINDFEQDMIDNETCVTKFWLSITKDEQLRRFKEREAAGFKRFKIGPDDWRNRKQWDAYVDAVDDMVDRTSTGAAPWYLIEANDKRFARIKVLKTLCERIEATL